MDPTQPLGKFLPQLHSIAEGEASGLRDARGALMPPCIIMEKGEALDVWIENSGDAIDLFAGLQVCPVVPSCITLTGQEVKTYSWGTQRHTRSASHLFFIAGNKHAGNVHCMCL